MTTNQIDKPDHVYDLKRLYREAAEFRKIMTDRRNSIDYIDRALGCLFIIICRVEKEADEKAQQLWETLTTEWSRRKMLMILNGHPIEEPKQ